MWLIKVDRIIDSTVIMASLFLSVLFLIFSTASVSLAHEDNVTVSWVRTAKGNNDRLSPQKDIALAEDFKSNITITVNR